MERERYNLKRGIYTVIRQIQVERERESLKEEQICTVVGKIQVGRGRESLKEEHICTVVGKTWEDACLKWNDLSSVQ